MVPVDGKRSLRRREPIDRTEKRNPLTPPRRSDRGATPSAAVPSGRRSGRRASTRFPASQGTGTGRRERVNERALADAPVSFARAARGRCARSRLVPSTCSAVHGQLAPAPRPGEPRTPAVRRPLAPAAPAGGVCRRARARASAALPSPPPPTAPLPHPVRDSPH